VNYDRFAPQPSLLMLRHPFAGHALGLGDLGGGHLASGLVPVFPRRRVTLFGSQDYSEGVYAARGLKSEIKMQGQAPRFVIGGHS